MPKEEGLPDLCSPGWPAVRRGRRVDARQTDELDVITAMEDGPEAVRAAVGVLAHPAQNLIQVGLRQLPLNVAPEGGEARSAEPGRLAGTPGAP